MNKNYYKEDRKIYTLDNIKGRIMYTQYEIGEGYNVQTMVDAYVIKDALSYHPKMTYIDLIEVDAKGQGYGTKLLQAFLSEHQGEFITLNAAAIDEDVYNTCLDEHLDKLTRFYERNGFINVNNRIGVYEESIVFAYNNEMLVSLGLNSCVKDTNVIPPSWDKK